MHWIKLIYVYMCDSQTWEFVLNGFSLKTFEKLLWKEKWNKNFGQIFSKKNMWKGTERILREIDLFWHIMLTIGI